MAMKDQPLHFLIATDFDVGSIARNDLVAEIHFGGWIVDRIPYLPHEMVADINENDVDVLVVEEDQVPETVFSECPSLKVVISMRSNPVNIDLAAAVEHDVLVLYTPGRNAQSVAELTLCLMIDLLRNYSASFMDLKNGHWGTGVEDPYLRFRGRELNGRIVGLVGFGAIGQCVAQLLAGFDVVLLAYDPYQAPDVFLKFNARSLSLDDLLGEAEIISIHTPLNAETKDLIGGREFSLMKSGGYLVNTARAGIINQAAFLEALKQNKLAGAALDVHYQEPPSLEDPFAELDNVIRTPHIGGATCEVITRGSAMAVQDLTRFLRGEEPRWSAAIPNSRIFMKGKR